MSNVLLETTNLDDQVGTWVLHFQETVVGEAVGTILDAAVAQTVGKVPLVVLPPEVQSAFFAVEVDHSVRWNLLAEA